MVELPNGEKNFEDMFSSVARIPYRRVTDRRANRRLDILRRRSPRYAYASRGKNPSQSVLCWQLDLGAKWHVYWLGLGMPSEAEWGWMRQGSRYGCRRRRSSLTASCSHVIQFVHPKPGCPMPCRGVGRRDFLAWVWHTEQ